MTKAILDSLHDFCQAELDRRSTGVVETEIADAKDAVSQVKRLRKLIVEKGLPPDDFWQAVDEPTAETLALYQAERPGKQLPPKGGEQFILLTGSGAVFVAIERPNGALQCVFRNESAFKGPFWSSVLIRQAMEHVWNIWPEKRLFAMVPVKGKEKMPGLSFRMAGWNPFGFQGSNSVMKIGADPRWARQR